MTTVISIDYDEFDQKSYRGCCASFNGTEGVRINSGYPHLDFAMVLGACISIDGVENISYSSSVDHFVMDGDEFIFVQTPSGGNLIDKAERQND